MKNALGGVLYWTPRILGIGMALFVGLFALDVFAESAPLNEKLAGFLIHMMPTFAMLIVLGFAWRNEILGGALYLALFILFLLFFGRGAGFENILVLFSPLVLIGVLFIASGWRRRQAH